MERSETFSVKENRGCVQIKKIVSRGLIIGRINDFFENKVSVADFGEEMFQYFAFDERYKYEEGYEKLLEEVLKEFMDMHDAGKDVGYEPHIPSKERFLEIKVMLFEK